MSEAKKRENAKHFRSWKAKLSLIGFCVFHPVLVIRIFREQLALVVGRLRVQQKDTDEINRWYQDN